jgi:transcriptional regulator with XRE-family HTH domain
MARVIDGPRLKKAARELGLSFKELAQELGVSRPTLYAYAAGRLRVDEAKLEMIAELLRCPPDYLAPPAEGGAPQPGGVLAYVEALLAAPDPKAALQACGEALSELDIDPATRAALLKHAGNALLYMGQYVRAAEHLREASSIAQHQGLVEVSAACSQSLGYCYINLGELDAAREAFQFAAANYEDQSKWKPRISMAALDEREGRISEARAALSQLEASEQTLQARLYTLANKASLLASTGHWRHALETNAAAHALAHNLAVRDQISETMLLNALCHLRMGEPDRASLWLIRGRDAAVASQDSARLALSKVLQAHLWLAVSEPAKARGVALDAHNMAIEGMYRRTEALALMVLSKVSFSMQDVEGALAYARQGETFCKAHRYVALAWEARLLQIEHRASANTDGAPTDELRMAVEDLALYGEQSARARIILARVLSQSDAESAAEEAKLALVTATQVGSPTLQLEALRAMEHVALAQKDEMKLEKLRECIGSARSREGHVFILEGSDILSHQVRIVDPFDIDEKSFN